MSAPPPSLRDWFAALWALRLGGPRALWTLLRLWAGRSTRQRQAAAALHRERTRHRRQPRQEPLRQLAPLLFEVDAGWLTPGPADGPRLAVTVVHLLGSGEIRYSPLSGLRRLCAEQPELARCRHLVADTTHEAGAFLGADEFSIRMGHTLAPALADCPDTLVFAGLSCRARTALELRTRPVSEHDRPVEVLACAAPLRCDYALPDTVRTLAALAPHMNLMATVMARPSPLNPLLRSWLRRLFVMNTGIVLGELAMHTPQALAWFGRYTEDEPTIDICLRALRELDLLVRVSDAELRHMVAGVAARAAEAEGVRMTACWGEDDAWVPPERCAARMGDAVARQGVPEARYRIASLAASNHGIGRQRDADYGALAELFMEVCARAAAADLATGEGSAHATGG
ncbi:MAG: hypothetical protein OXT09_04570 [Myxococcales bacterium]|nr:hypothetical protein [Myxococcales bacterium]